MKITAAEREEALALRLAANEAGEVADAAVSAARIAESKVASAVLRLRCKYGQGPAVDIDLVSGEWVASQQQQAQQPQPVQLQPLIAAAKKKRR